MKTLDRWILRRFTLAYLGFACSVLLVYVITDLFNRFDKFVGGDKPFLQLFFEHYVTIVPEIYYVLAPFITLIAGTWVVFELQRNNELVPLLAAGVRPFRIVLPIFVAATVLGAVTWADREYVLPHFAEKRREATKLRRDVLIPTPVPDRFGGVLMARSYLSKDRMLEEARYEQVGSVTSPSISIIASYGVWNRQQEVWVFKSGIHVAVSPDGEARVTSFGVAGRVVPTDVYPQDVESACVETVAYLTADQIRAQIKRVPGQRHLEVELAKRWSYPASSLVLLILGFPFVMRGDAREAALGLLGCFAICALYFLATAFSEDWGSRPGSDHPELAAWLPNLAFGTAGLAVFLRRAGKA